MRLKDKLIHTNCPSCEGAITLSASSLNKKINCPRCRQTVIIPDGGGTAPEKPFPKKAVAKEKSNGRHTPAEEPETAMEEAGISIQSIQSPHPADEIPAPIRHETDMPASQKKAVVYCLCNGILKKRRDSKVCCVFASEMGF